MQLANASPLGLTAGFYGGADEVGWFQEHIEAGVTYANRPQGATTGAWPGLSALRRLEGLGHAPARRSPPSITCRSTCASSRRPWSSERMPLAAVSSEAIATVTCTTAQSVALEGFTHLIPFAAGHEIIRQRRRELHLIRMTPDLIYDQMIGAGCAARLTFSWGGNPGVGSLHRLRDAVEHEWPQPLALTEFTHARDGGRLPGGRERPALRSDARITRATGS